MDKRSSDPLILKSRHFVHVLRNRCVIGHCQHDVWICLFLEASCFFWVSTLLLITVTIWFATQAEFWHLPRRDLQPGWWGRGLGWSGWRRRRWRDGRGTHVTTVAHIRWDAESLSDASEMGGDHMRGQTDTSMVLPQKNYDVQSVSKAARVSTIQHIPVFPRPLRLASFRAADLHISPRIHMYQSTQTYGHYFVTYEILSIGIILSESCRHQ